MRLLRVILVGPLLGLTGCAAEYGNEPGYYGLRPPAVVAPDPVYGYGPLYAYRDDAYIRRPYSYRYRDDLPRDRFPRREWRDRHRLDRPQRETGSRERGWQPPRSLPPATQELLRDFARRGGMTQ